MCSICFCFLFLFFHSILSLEPVVASSFADQFLWPIWNHGFIASFCVWSFTTSLTEDENDKEDEDKTSMAPRRRRSQTPPEDGTTSRRSARLKEFEKALDESVASDDHFLEMVRENRTRLSVDTKEWTDQYSLDDGSISAMAERLMEVGAPFTKSPRSGCHVIVLIVIIIIIIVIIIIMIIIIMGT